MDPIVIHNAGPEIVATNFWGSELELAGEFYCSVNAGVIRLLLPVAASYGTLNDMISAEYCIISKGPWPEQKEPEAIEILFEDRSDSPYALQLAPASFDLLPGEPPEGRDWVFSLWTFKDGHPFKLMERACYWRRVSRIPCRQAWKNEMLPPDLD